jgi:hypothetical protein
MLLDECAQFVLVIEYWKLKIIWNLEIVIWNLICTNQKEVSNKMRSYAF